MAVVKADGYGHGAVRVSQIALEGGADCLGVAFAEEGAELRERGIDAPIYILSEPFVEAIPLILEYDLVPAVYTEKFLQALSREARRRESSARVHFKVDTGMNRVGVHYQKALPFLEKIFETPAIVLEGVFTHFARADEPDCDFTLIQTERFKRIVERVREVKKDVLVHAANTAATVLFPETHFDMVRIGIGLYGLHPSPFTEGRISLEPALSWRTRIAYLKEVEKGEGISYGHTFKTKEKSLIATLPLGYADGFRRVLSNQGEVLVRGKRCPVVGTVCMDQFLVDVTEVGNVSIGEEVVLIGKQGGEEITATEVAEKLGTINYEVVCSIGKRVPRIYKE